MTEHLPLTSKGGHIHNAIGETFAVVGILNHEAKARFIVTACNCHADLLEALKKARGIVSVYKRRYPNSVRGIQIGRQVDEAIRKAEETP